MLLADIVLNCFTGL